VRVDRTGCTRIVLLTQRYAIKLPNFLNGWRLFLTGLLANMQERQFVATGWPELCPVLFSLPGGWLVVMPCVRVMNEDEFTTFDAASFCGRLDGTVPAEMKSNSFGFLDGRVVAIDYGN
jgi:hypothetical protein